MVGIISFFIGLFIGFCTCALLSANKIDGEIYYIDMSDKNEEIDDDDDEGDNDEEI